MEEGKEKLLTEFLTLTNQHKEEIVPEEILKSLPIQNRTSQVPANARPLTIDQAEQPEENSLTESMTEQQKKVYGMLTKQPQPLEELAQRCQMSVGELTSILFEIGVPDPIEGLSGKNVQPEVSRDTDSNFLLRKTSAGERSGGLNGKRKSGADRRKKDQSNSGQSFL